MASVIWIDATSGNDTTGTGSREAPYLTIEKGLTIFTDKDQIRLLDGTYTPIDSIVISNLEGSLFAENPNAVYIQPVKTQAHPACVAILNSTRFTVQGITILAPTDTTGNLYGLYAAGVTNFKAKTVEVDNFTITGTGAAIAASGTGRIEGSLVTDFTADVAYGIKSVGLQVVDCAVSSVSGGICRGIDIDGNKGIVAIPDAPSYTPSYYPDNVAIQYSEDMYVRGNTVSDCYGADVVGMAITNCDVLRMYSNQVSRMRSMLSSKGYTINRCTDAMLLYTVASRCKVGLDIDNLGALSIYNITTHDCSDHVQVSMAEPAIIKNAVASNYQGDAYYTTSRGYVLGTSTYLSLDYFVYFGLQTLSAGSGTFVEGDNSYTDKPLYLDETPDQLAPDHISIMVNTGTASPLAESNPDIGGVNSEITNETVAGRRYYQSLLDNTFWDVDNDQSVEVSLIKAFQSRVLANSAAATSTVQLDYFVKTMTSTEAFSSIFPAYAVYANQQQFVKRVQDLWYATQTPSTLQSMQNAIGGYTLFPTFFQQLQDVQGHWVLGNSAIGVDNTLLGGQGVRYGIEIEPLGISTLAASVSGECYDNTRNCITDLAPTHWDLQHWPQPDTYFLFTDMWNNYEECTLSNMHYNNEYNIQPTVAGAVVCTTPLITTDQSLVSGGSAAPSGSVEVSLLDRVYSENITRTFAYRIGPSESAMSSWANINQWIGGNISLEQPYVQFRITATGLLRKDDYEFVGFALRPYNPIREPTPREPTDETLTLDTEAVAGVDTGLYVGYHSWSVGDYYYYSGSTIVVLNEATTPYTPFVNGRTPVCVGGNDPMHITMALDSGSAAEGSAGIFNWLGTRGILSVLGAHFDSGDVGRWIERVSTGERAQIVSVSSASVIYYDRSLGVSGTESWKLWYRENTATEGGCVDWPVQIEVT